MWLLGHPGSPPIVGKAEKLSQKCRPSGHQIEHKKEVDQMALSAELKTEIITDYRRSDSDSGSPEVQVALLTARVNELTEHLRQHKHDYASRRGLLMMVSKRNGLLRYLARTNRGRYQELIGRLGLRK